MTTSADLDRPGAASRHDRLAAFGGSPAVPREMRDLPWPVITDADRAAVVRTLDGGRLVSNLDSMTAVSALEDRWAARCGVPACVATSNGTTALAVALSALGIGAGDRVIVPALSFVASGLAPLHQMAQPVFADIDPVTFTLDPQSAAAAVTDRTAAILPVHLHGHPADMAGLDDLARRHGLAQIEDAAQAHGATWHGRPVGALGDAAAFSLQVTKNLPTCGEGGLVTFRDEAAGARGRRIRQFGEDITPGKPREYVSHELGWNAKMSAVQAAFTLSQLDRFDDYDAARQQHVPAFLGRLAQLPGLVVPRADPQVSHAWHILRFRCDPESAGLTDVAPAAFRQALHRLLRAEGVPLSRYQLMPLPAQPVFRAGSGIGGASLRDGRPAAPVPTPVTQAVIEDSLTLQKRHLNPEAGPVLQRYADAFEKVWNELPVVAAMARGIA